MAVFTITTFSTFAALLVAGHKLATDPNPLNRLEAIADLATNTKALAAALRDTGLTPIAQEMARRAEETAAHFTHEGPAKDDARALFWQVAPAAFAAPDALTGGNLDPATVTDRMVAAIRTSPHARDFFAARLPEQFFRAVAHQTLDVMLRKADFIAGITPDLWRRVLRDHGMQIELLIDIDETTRRAEATLNAKADETLIEVRRVRRDFSQKNDELLARDREQIRKDLNGDLSLVLSLMTKNGLHFGELARLLMTIETKGYSIEEVIDNLGRSR